MKAKLRIANEIFSWILLIAVSVMLVFSIFTVFKAKETGEGAFIFGYRPVLVLTGSMEPYMMTNGLALTKQVDDIEDIEVGDVITFHLDSSDGDRLLITHRIVDMKDGYIYTKGDNNRVDDSIPLTMENVEAKVVLVLNFTAWIAAKWQTTAGKIMLISAVFAVILIYISLKLLFRGREEDEQSAEAAESVEGDGSNAESVTSPVAEQPVPADNDVAQPTDPSGDKQ